MPALGQREQGFQKGRVKEVAVNRLRLNVSEIIPGDWGKVESGWLTPPLSSSGRKEGAAEARFTSPSGGVRAPSVTRIRGLAVRDNQKLFRAGSSRSGWFQARPNRSYPGGKRLLLRTSTRRVTLAVPLSGIRQTKGAERRDKVSTRSGKHTWSRQDP
jgi:hypothetical protein